MVLAQGQLWDLAKVSLQIQVVPPCIDPPFVAPVYRKTANKEMQTVGGGLVGLQTTALYALTV